MRAPQLPPDLHTWSMSDGYALRGRIWRPRRATPGHCIIYVHGIQSHGGWFEWSASLLAQVGTTVVLPDRRGSGLNQADRGDTPSAERWLADVDEVAEWAAREFAVERFGLVGVSWGGKLVAAWATRRPERVARVLLVAPGLFPAVDLGPAAKLRVGLSLLTGGRRRFDIPLSDPALFTDNPAGQRFIADDLLKLRRVTARFFRFSRRLDRRLLALKPGQFPGPITVAMAGQDQIIRNRPTAAWVRRVSAQLPDINVFGGCAHTLEFEPDTAEFADLLRRWSLVDAGDASRA